MVGCAETIPKRRSRKLPIIHHICSILCRLSLDVIDHPRRRPLFRLFASARIFAAITTLAADATLEQLVFGRLFRAHDHIHVDRRS
jgi:hypothetical protein